MATSPRMSGYPYDSTFRQPRVKQRTRLDALRQVGLFKGLSKRSLIRIDQVSEVRLAHADQILVAQGETGTEMMVVLTGRAAVTRGDRKLSELSVGAAFGEMALLDKQHRSATVTALEQMQVLVIDGPTFRNLLAKVPGLTDRLLATLSERLREANEATDI